MPPDTALYYINRRIDSLEVSLKEDNTEIKALLKDHLDNCNVRMKSVTIRIGKLEGFKNKALGAVVLFLFLIGIWQGIK